MPEPLTKEQVLHVAKLARLRLQPDQVEHYRSQLSSILEHVSQLGELDLTDVEPLSHPIELVNHLADDVVSHSMPIEKLFQNAPATRDRFLTVPKVLGKNTESA